MRSLLTLWVCAWLQLGCAMCVAQEPAMQAKVTLPKVALTANELAVVINDLDPVSVEVGAYYVERRAIPPANVFHVRIAPDRNYMTRAEFQMMKGRLERHVPERIQAYVLVWLQPYRVECMSMSMAMAAGYEDAYCATGCKTTKPSPYYNSDSVAPYRDFKLRPTMMLGARDVESAKALIDRGIRSDGTWPAGTGYLVSTSDAARNVRAMAYPHAHEVLDAAVHLEDIKTDALEGKTDVLFYFTGMERVAKISSNHFIDGALADHLTSAGGMLTDSSQMSCMEWINAGATGSYGTALEPCNYPAKFPDIGVVMGRYLMGETLIEAYWKSVQMPGQGNFVGEPLASPFSGMKVVQDKADLLVRTHALRPGRYVLQASRSPMGPWRTLAQGAFGGVALREVRIANASEHFYRLEPAALVQQAGQSTDRMQ
jgi:uncharacterized protein (TIGR03790 family)